jgi:phosphoglycerate dehydrogenase-like enzyme/glyoxylase-like metal-dependent hydrolase (beta-lactamase superfamily II)
MRLRFLVLGVFLLSVLSARAADELPKMQFNEVKEVAPGVFFRYSSISATDKNVVFGGSNNIWVVFEDYVVVVDANFPTGAGECIEAIKKTTKKPIRYVLDTHHHGDHAYGNDIFAQAGASIVAQANCARLLRINGPKEFLEAGKVPGEKYGVDKSKLKVPSIVFDDKLVLDDGKQRVEFLFLGHAHTAGDAVAYLPKQKILCTGDACVNGAFNFMGHADSASWIRTLERMQQLDVKMVCPGHGPIAGRDLLERQRRYFVELREIVQKGIAAKQNPEEIHKSIDLAWYKEWTGVQPAIDNVKFVYDEFTGRTAPSDLIEDFGIYEGPSPTKESAGWKKPKRIVVPSGLMPARLEELKLIAPDVEFVPAKSAEDALKVIGDADALVGFGPTSELVKAGKNLRWIQVAHAGVEKDLPPELVKGDVIMTNTARIYGPQVADQAFALLLTLTRHVKETATEKLPDLTELHGKTMLVVGLGGVGTQIARRAEAFGMRVLAVDPKVSERPAFVFSLDKPDKLADLLPKADVVVLACPLTAETRGLIGSKQLGAMKATATLINVGRGELVETGALVAALSMKKLAGAGLDVSDPEPLPKDHPLRLMTNVIVSAHVGGQSPEGRERQWRLFRENVRRFVAGEPLLCVVDKAKGY